MDALSFGKFGIGSLAKNSIQLSIREAGNVINSTRTVLPKLEADKWIRSPASLQDQMALNAAQSGQGRRIIENLNDPIYKGMEKWEYKVKSNEGLDSVVHYVRDPRTESLMDFKFTKRSMDEIGRYRRDPDGGPK